MSLHFFFVQVNKRHLNASAYLFPHSVRIEALEHWDYNTNTDTKILGIKHLHPWTLVLSETKLDFINRLDFIHDCRWENTHIRAEDFAILQDDLFLFQSNMFLQMRRDSSPVQIHSFPSLEPFFPMKMCSNRSYVFMGCSNYLCCLEKDKRGRLSVFQQVYNGAKNRQEGVSLAANDNNLIVLLTSTELCGYFLAEKKF